MAFHSSFILKSEFRGLNQEPDCDQRILIKRLAHGQDKASVMQIRQIQFDIQLSTTHCGRGS